MSKKKNTPAKSVQTVENYLKNGGKITKIPATKPNEVQITKPTSQVINLFHNAL